MALVSLIVPIYNVAAYVEKCLLSVFEQTYDNIEYIIVDDCGSDNSMDLVRTLVENTNFAGKTIRIIRHACNKGVAAARNTGLDAAVGDYIFFMDSDDTLTPNCIEDHVAYLEKYNVDFTTADINFIGGRRVFKSLINNRVLCNHQDILENYFLKYIHHSPCNKLLKRTFLEKNQIRFMEGLLYEDALWSFEIAFHARSVAILPKRTYNYIIHEGSFTTTDRNMEHRMDSRIYIINAIINYMESCNSPEIRLIANRYISERRFKILAGLVGSNAGSYLKRKYYQILNGPEYRCYDYGLGASLMRLPYPFFYVIIFLIVHIFKLYKKIIRRICK
mgnify:CR=1 FL=1